MKLEIFEEKVKDIFFYCCNYGAYTLFNGKEATEKFDIKEFNRLCFKGFKVAQKKILSELKDLQLIRKKNQQEIKKAKQERNKSLVTERLNEARILDFQSDIFRNLADSLVWQMVDGQHYLYRRLFTYDTGEKNLSDNSFNYVIDFTDRINVDSESFCLITDITNNIQLGDCLIVDKEGIKVTEIKSGKKNLKALNFIQDEKLNDDNYDETQLKKTFDDKFVKQIKRMLIQKGKTNRAATIIKNNIGADPKFKDSTVKIIENDFKIETYHSTLFELIKQTEKKDWAYDCVEDVVHIGVYRNDWRIYGQKTMKDLCSPFQFMDFISGRNLICEPIFMKPFTDQIILDIVLSRLKIYIGIDFEKLIELANFLGINATWSSSKDLHRFLDDKSFNTKEIFSFNNKGITINFNDQKIFLGQGFIGKIIFDHILPSTMLLKYKNQLSSKKAL